MNKIIVKGTELNVLYAGVGPLHGKFKAQIYFGNRTLSEVAALLDGADVIEHITDEKTETFEHYSRLVDISFVDNETVLVFNERVGVSE